VKFHPLLPGLLALAMAGLVAAEPAAQIVPGKGIGSLQIGMTIAEVGEFMGHPELDDAAMGTGFQGWKLPGGALIVRYHRVSKGGKYRGQKLDHDEWVVTQIRVTSSKFSTKSDIHVGSPLGDIRKSFAGLGTTSARGNTPSLDLYDDVKSGIAFEIEISNPIDTSRWHCGAIIVHAPGEPIRKMLSWPEKTNR